MSGWKNRIVGLGEEDPEQLLANPLNFRTHSGPQRDAMRGSLNTVGWTQAVVVNQGTGFVVDGHLRIEEAISKHEKTVPVLYVDLTAEEEAIILASLDAIGAMADVDQKRLDELLADLHVDDAGLEALLNSLRGQQIKTGNTDPDDIPEVRVEPGVVLGQMFQMGDHRILCGDSTIISDVERLMEGAIADMIWTDPPYGVDYVGKTKDALKIKNDKFDPAKTRILVADALKIAPLRQGGVFYIASPGGNMEPAFRGALEDAALTLHEVIIWVKDRFVMGRSDYHWRHEPILYGWKDGAAHFWCGDRKQDTVWEIPKPAASESHPTMKPVELVTRSVQNSSQPNDTVYEPFAGSGTTIIAAEMLGRHCMAIEIDPKYVAVSLERWQSFTGLSAIDLGTGKPWTGPGPT
jgi:DNA modification methylase